MRRFPRFHLSLRDFHCVLNIALPHRSSQHECKPHRQQCSRSNRCVSCFDLTWTRAPAMDLLSTTGLLFYTHGVSSLVHSSFLSKFRYSSGYVVRTSTKSQQTAKLGCRRMRNYAVTTTRTRVVLPETGRFEEAVEASLGLDKDSARRWNYRSNTTTMLAMEVKRILLPL